MLARREDVLDLGAADDMLDHFGAKLTRHRVAHLIGQMIDHVEILELDAVTLRQRRCLGIRADVEADDGRARRRGQLHVALGDPANARAQHADLDEVGRNLVDGIDDGFSRTLDIGLDHDGIFHRLDGAQIGKQIFHINRRRNRPFFGGEVGTIERHFARTRFVLDDRHRIACGWHA